MLQRAQIGNRLSNVVFPPLLSGMLCPHWKSNALILFLHHTTEHFASNLPPIVFNQTCSRNALGILVFLYGDSDRRISDILDRITILLTTQRMMYIDLREREFQSLSPGPCLQVHGSCDLSFVYTKNLQPQLFLRLGICRETRVGIALSFSS